MRMREATLAFIDAVWTGMLLPSAVIEKRWGEGLMSSSSPSKERERVLPFHPLVEGADATMPEELEVSKLIHYQQDF